MSIVGTSLTVRYPGGAMASLHDVDVQVEPGQLLVVAGPNGSGKSTMFRSLLGLVHMQAGSVVIDDRPLAAWRRNELARTVGALPQREEPAFPQSVAEAVMLGRWARLGPVAPVGTADHAAVARALEQCGITALSHRTTDTLSGGEWQRVRLARALAAEPRYLLLDEPATALDLAHEMAVLELLRQLADSGLGIMAITHHLNAAVQYADRVLLLERGQVAAVGMPSEVLTADTVSDVFNWPVQVQRLDNGATHLIPMRKEQSK